MKKTLKKLLLKLFDPIASKLGYVKNEKLQPSHSKNTLLHDFFSTLKSLGFAPRHIVDVGANHGAWTRKALKYFPTSRYTLLEPQVWMKDSIKDLLDNNPQINFHAVGAGKESGIFKFTIVDRDDSCSFAYSEEEAKAKGFKQIEIPVTTLNELLVKEEVPDLIKIDAEGLDLQVLEGANDFFGKTEIFMVEASIMSNSIDNTVKNVIDFMDKKGYQLFDITDLNRPFSLPVLWLAELVFIKKDGNINSKIEKAIALNL